MSVAGEVSAEERARIEEAEVSFAERLSWPLMIAVGAKDQNPSPEDAEALAERLRLWEGVRAGHL